MANTTKYFTKGIELRGETADLSNNVEGTLWNNSTSAKLKLYIGAAVREIITADQVQTLTNKTIDASANTISNLTTSMLASGVLNTSTSLATASDAQVPSALAVKSYVDAGLALQNDASEIAFVPNGDITSTNVQAAIVEVRDDTDTKLGLKVDKTTTVNGYALSANVTLAKADVGLGNVDNTSDATKNAAAVTLTNKTIDTATNTITGLANSSIATGAAIARTKLASGTASVVLANNGSGVMSEITDFTVGTNNLTLASTKHLEIQATSDNTTTGSNASLATFTGGAIRLTNSSLGSLANIPAGSNGQQLALINRTGSDVTINDSVGAFGTAANRIYTGTSADITLAKDASLFFQYDSTSSRWQVTGGSGGSGGTASLNTIFQLTGAELASAWTTGNNATFLGAGSISGTFVKETSTPLHGVASYKFTQAAGSLNDYFVSTAQTVDLRFRGQQTFLTFPYQYNGLTNDIQIILYDATNSAIITSTTDVVIGTNGATSSAIVGAIIPLTCASIRIGFQVKVLNSGKILSFDDIQLSTDITAVSNVANITNWASYTPIFTGFGTPTAVEFEYRQNGQNYDIRGKFQAGTVTGVEARVSLPNSAISADTSIIPSIQMAGQVVFGTTGTAQYVALIEPSVGYLTFGQQSAGVAGLTKQNANAPFGNNYVIAIQASVPIAGLQSYNSSVVVPSQQVSSDIMSFAFKSTAIDPSVDPIGTFNTYTYAASGGAITISASTPTQTTSSMNINGVQVFGRAYNATSTTASPTRFDIFIGKGLKSKQIDAYGAAAKATQISTDYFSGSSTIEGGTKTYYSELTGILTIEAASSFNATTTRYVGFDSSGNAYTSAYFVFNASKSPSLVTIPNQTQRIAYLSDVKASGTAGGATSATTTATRTLNTIVDSTGIVTSLASNQFTLPAGTYHIDASAPAQSTAAHRIRLRNITDSTTSLLGSSETSTNASTVTSSSRIVGELTITSSKVFELQHYTTTAQPTNGFGIASGTGENEVYAQVKIIRIK